jgi:hypothetical protein
MLKIHQSLQHFPSIGGYMSTGPNTDDELHINWGCCFRFLWSFDKQEVCAKTASQFETGKRSSEFQCVRLPHSKIKNPPHSRDTVSANTLLLCNYKLPYKDLWFQVTEDNTENVTTMLNKNAPLATTILCNIFERCKVRCRNFWTKIK